MIAKVTILIAIFAAVNANFVSGHGALVNTGVSSRSPSQDAYLNYAFGYDIKDGLDATNSRSEVGDAHGNKKGSYIIADIEGRARRVDYVADGHGFKAIVKTNEPGTAASAPAAALVASLSTGPIAPDTNHVAPFTAIVGHAAPLSVAAPGTQGDVLGHGAGASAVYDLVIRHGAALGFGYGLEYDKALIH